MCKGLASISCSKGSIVVSECGKDTPYRSYEKRSNGVVLSGDSGRRYLYLNSVVGYYTMADLCEALEECLCYIPMVQITDGNGNPINEVEKDQFLNPELCTVYANDDLKRSNPIDLVRYFDCVNNKFVQFEQGVTPDDGNIFDITNFIKMSNIAGNVIPADLAAKTKNSCVTLCVPAGGAITFADVLTEAIADGLTLPDGTPPTGFLLDSVTKFQIGQLGQDAAGVTKKDGVQVVYLDTDEAINAGSTYCPDEPIIIDEDCDGFFVGYDATRTIANPSATEDALIRVCGTFIPFDTDDTDETVQ